MASPVGPPLPTADIAGDSNPDIWPAIDDGSCPAWDRTCPMLCAAIDGADITDPIISWADPMTCEASPGP